VTTDQELQQAHPSSLVGEHLSTRHVRTVDDAERSSIITTGGFW